MLAFYQRKQTMYQLSKVIIAVFKHKIFFYKEMFHFIGRFIFCTIVNSVSFNFFCLTMSEGNVAIGKLVILAQM